MALDLGLSLIVLREYQAGPPQRETVSQVWARFLRFKLLQGCYSYDGSIEPRTGTIRWGPAARTLQMDGKEEELKRPQREGKLNSNVEIGMVVEVVLKNWQPSCGFSSAQTPDLVITVYYA
jgi:hypothetical protein